MKAFILQQNQKTMTAVEHAKILSRLDDLIKMKATGAPQELAQKLGISRSSLFRYLDELKKLNAPVRFCTKRKSYLYEKDFSLEF
jgi:DNA-binding IclR family transcriptional regulator